MSDVNGSRTEGEENKGTFHHWFEQPLGQAVLAQERFCVNEVLPELFGFHLLQVGDLDGRDFFSQSRISHKVLMFREEKTSNCSDSAFVGDELAMAIESDSLDVLLLPHVLETTANPYKLLREAERVLIGEGHLLVSGFQPWSLWGIWKSFLWWKEQPPWNAHFYTKRRLHDWLNLLDFEVVRFERYFYRPPLNNMNFLNKLGFLEKIGKYCWPFFGGAYLIVARKRVATFTPMKTQWRTRRQLIASGIIEPSARNVE